MRFILLLSLLSACAGDQFTAVQPPECATTEKPPVDNKPPPVVGPLIIRDTTIQGTDADQPVGPSPVLSAGLSGDYIQHRILVSIDNIPAGVLTGFRLVIWQRSALSSGIVDVLPLTAVNTWDEDQADYYHSNHANRTPWGGPARGLGAIGVDYDSMGEAWRWAIHYSPQEPGEGIRPYVVELPVSLLYDWRDGVRPNNGLILKTRYEAGPDLVEFLSHESANGPLSVEINTAQ